MSLRIDNDKLSMADHSCTANEVKRFIIEYAMMNCRKNVLSNNNQLKVTIACFRQWHVEAFNIEAMPKCKRAFSIYLPIVAEELGFKVIRDGIGKYLLIPI